MKKKGGLIAIMLILIFAVIGCSNDTVSNNTDKWEDYLTLMYATQPDTSWFDANKEATSYELSSANDLLGVMVLVDSGEEDFEGKTINLAKGTYDFSRWSTNYADEIEAYIGSGDRDDLASASAFKGSFNGNGSTIKGLNLSYDSSKKEDGTAVGFFGVVQGTEENPITIEGLIFEGLNIASDSNTTGAAIGYAEYANIKDIVVKDSTVKGPQGVGAIVGRLYKGGSIENCQNLNTSVYATASTVDYGTDAGTGNYNAGGIVGCVKDGKESISIIVENNTVDLGSNAVVSADYSFAGGVCGTAFTSTFNKNIVTIAAKDQIAVTTPNAGKAGAINGNGNGAAYGDDGNVNTIIIAGESFTIADNAADNIATLSN